MVQKKATVRNHAGIHCRPSALIIKEAGSYSGRIRLDSQSGSSDLRSVLELISLGLDHGSELTISVTGPDEEAFCARLVALFETEFDFPPL